MSRVKKLILIILVLVCVGTGFLLFIKKTSENNNLPISLNQNTNLNKELKNEPISKAVKLVIDFGDGKKLEYNIEAEGKMTVLDVLKKSTLKIETKDYSFGIMVRTIEGVKNGVGDKYWIYYVNNVLGTIGADSQKVAPRDEILWRFEKNKF